jgi:putative restriction endonuclease
LRIRVSDKVNGNGMEEWLLRFEGKPIILPRKKQYYPQPEFIQWHVNEVFKTYGNR